jgi:hypothetical protein
MLGSVLGFGSVRHDAFVLGQRLRNKRGLHRLRKYLHWE